tara:strand:+ start:518 stop:727 length:210 start_codon:yes stop_codon:yes gene_type:complete
MTEYIIKTWIEDGKIIAQTIPEAEIYKREWVGLTEEEISEVLGSDIHAEQSGELRFIRAIEAKLKEINK